MTSIAPQNELLLVDFDNTITVGDSLDSVIRTFSRSGRWMAWQDEWLEGRMSTRDCLERQIGELRVDRGTLEDFLAGIRVDPGLAELREWAQGAGATMIVVSDNFEPIVQRIFEHCGIAPPTVFANGLAFDGERLVPSFPYADPDCPACAHCKSVHYARYPGHRTIYVGDGRSDLCAAQRADLVFAKDRLAEGLRERHKAYRPFRDLGEVAQALRGGFEESAQDVADAGNGRGLGP